MWVGKEKMSITIQQPINKLQWTPMPFLHVINIDVFKLICRRRPSWEIEI